MADAHALTPDQQGRLRDLLNNVAGVDDLATLLCRRGTEFERRHRQALKSFEAASLFLRVQGLQVSAMVTVATQGATHNSPAPGVRFYLSYSRLASGFFGIRVCAYATNDDTDAPFLQPNEAAPAVLVFLERWIPDLMAAVEQKAVEACMDPAGWRALR